ncbi:MAG: 30S ribosomal protein S20 [Alphaproteobacteria bacterium]
MANHESAKKRIRRNGRRAEINHSRVSRIRTFVRKVEAAITAKDKEQAKAAFDAAVPEMMRGVNKGVIHRNAVARKMSRLHAAIKGL